MSPALSLDDVTLVHRDGQETVTALDRVTVDVRPGEFVAVIGPSGAGKSSLLAVAGALTRPTSGSVRLDGIDLVAARPGRRDAVRRDRIGFVFQANNLIPALTAIDQVRLPTTFARGQGRRDPMELLAEVGMEDKARRRPHELSGGGRQRVGIARALVTNPGVLLVDEPTAALDRQRSHDIVALLARESRQHDVATIMVTHDHDVLRHCDRAYEMVDGRLSPVDA